MIADARRDALAFDRAQRDIAAHEPRQPPHDRQAKAGADMAAARAAHALGELFKRAGNLGGGHADAGVLHLDHDHLGRGAVDGDGHAARIGELQRIAHQVVQDLDQAHLVAKPDLALLASDAAGDQLHLFVAGRDLVQRGDAHQDLGQPDRARVEDQTSGLDLREVKDVVDHA
jgi:hypothetical protein